MSAGTSIEWTDATWNPVRGCSRVSRACGGPGKQGGCYAEIMAARFSQPGQWGHGFAEMKGGDHRWTGRVEVIHSQLDLPLRWRKPRKIFVNSTSDLFHEKLPFSDIDRVFAVMALCPQHTFQVLTKRPERMHEYLTAARANPVGMEALGLTLDLYNSHPNIGSGVMLTGDIGHLKVWPLPNVWLGTSVEDQETANERIPHLLQTPAAVRFISAEPLLGPIDLSWIDDGAAHREVPREEWGDVDDDDSPPGLWWNALTGERTIMHGGAGGDWSRRDAALDWVITGGESGPGARPANPQWFRDLRDQCERAGVAFFFKQWGEWVSVSEVAGAGEHYKFPDGRTVRHIGKKKAGSALDGREWKEFPEARTE